jgi:pimeloyl-ACP methyl ester carboxylesterase
MIVAVVLLWAAPAQAFSKQTGFRTMADGTRIAYDLYQPAGAPPLGGRPGVVVLHGLGDSKDSVAPVAQAFVAHGYAALAYTARGNGTSTGTLGLAGPAETSDERAMVSWFTGLARVSDTNVGVWGISYGGGEAWNGLASGIPYKAAEVVETWTNLYSALWPQNVARRGIVAGLATAVLPRSPLIAQYYNDAVSSTNIAALKALTAPRSVATRLRSIRTPVYMFQGRVDYVFDVSQASNAYAQLAGPKRLYIGQFGHPPSTFPGPDVNYVLAQSLAWFDHFLRGVPNGIDRSKPVTVAAAAGSRRVSYAGLPRTKVVGVGFRGTTLRRVGPSFRSPLETFGVSLLRVNVARVSNARRLVAVVLAGSRVVTHGAVVPRQGPNTIRLANYVQFLPKGTRLTLRLGTGGGTDYAYGSGSGGRITVGSAYLSLQTLARPVSA